MSVKLRIAKATSIGGRDYQEDSCDVFLSPKGDVACAVVADGMGGHAAGDKVSEITVNTTMEQAAGLLDGQSPVDLVPKVVKSSHLAVTKFNTENSLDGRTTIVVAVLMGTDVFISNVGDSRAYHITKSKSVRITRDDSIPEMLVAMGDISEEEMATHPDQGRLTRSVGGDELPSPKLHQFIAEIGDVILLCTDGFWETIAPEEHATLLDVADFQIALEILCDLASRRGGEAGDNVTACAVRLELS